MSDLERAKEIAWRLDGRQRRGLSAFSRSYQPGPGLATATLNVLSDLQDLGLVDRLFGDMGPPKTTVGRSAVHVKLSACWHFRLSALGLAVRRILEEGNNV